MNNHTLNNTFTHTRFTSIGMNLNGMKTLQLHTETMLEHGNRANNKSMSVQVTVKMLACNLGKPFKRKILIESMSLHSI